MALPSAARGVEIIRADRIAGWLLLGSLAPMIVAVLMYGAGDPTKPLFLGAGLLVTLFGLIALEEALRLRGERLIPRFGTVAFAIGMTCFVIDDALSETFVGFVFPLERVYTVLACVAVALYGWSIVRSEALPQAIGWLAIAWALVDGVLYVARLFNPPLGPNLALFVIGGALVVNAARASERLRPPAHPPSSPPRR